MRRESNILRGGQYQLVDYIETLESAYINPEIPSWNYYTIEMEFMKTSSNYNFSLFCSSDNGTNWSGGLYFIQSTRCYPAVGSTNGATTYYISLNTKYKYIFSANQSTKAWATSMNTDSRSGTFSGNLPVNSNYHIVLFGHNLGTGYGVTEIIKSGMRIYSCKMTLDGVLVRDFVPAIDSTGKVGLLDQCGSTCSLTGTSFYPAANHFIYGNIIG